MLVDDIKAVLETQNNNLENGHYDQKLDYYLEDMRYIHPVEFHTAMNWAISNPELKNII